MGDTRDPESDQPLPEKGEIPVQAVLIEALRRRMEFGLKKYGRPLETHNGRDPLRDMWEEMLDMVSYFTQFVLEQGVALPGLEQFTMTPEPDSGKWRGVSADLYIEDEAIDGPHLTETGSSSGMDFVEKLVGAGIPPWQEERFQQILNQIIPSDCPMCKHSPHTPGGCGNDSPGGITSCMCGASGVFGEAKYRDML